MSRLHLDLRIHSSSGARKPILLLDVLQVLVMVVQRLVKVLKMCLTTPSVRQVHRQKQDTLKNNKHPSCASERMSQRVRILCSTASFPLRIVANDQWIFAFFVLLHLLRMLEPCISFFTSSAVSVFRWISLREVSINSSSFFNPDAAMCSMGSNRPHLHDEECLLPPVRGLSIHIFKIILQSLC